MQRRRAGRHGKKTRAHNGHASRKERAVRFYWSGRYCTDENGARGLSISCAAQRATPTIVQAEWTLAELISSWMHWLYLYSNQTEDDGLC